MKIVAIHQPDFFPYLGFFWKIMNCHELVILDDVQYSRRGMHDFNFIKTPQGKLKLKVPVTNSYYSHINQTVTAGTEWKARLVKTVEMNYKRSAHFAEAFPLIEDILTNSSENLAEMNERAYRMMFEAIGIDVPIVRASDLHIASAKEQRIIDICKQRSADVYLSGTGARQYQSAEDFARNGLLLKYAEFAPFEYPQLWGDFVPYLSVIDYLMNCGLSALRSESCGCVREG